MTHDSIMTNHRVNVPVSLLASFEREDAAAAACPCEPSASTSMSPAEAWPKCHELRKCEAPTIGAWPMMNLLTKFKDREACEVQQ